MPVIEFSDWVPDQAMMVTGVTMALNTIRTAGGYRPLAGLKALSQQTIPAPAQGLVLAHGSEDDLVVIAAGGDGNLYRFDRAALNWANVSKSHGAYAGATLWNFLEFGNKLLATNDVGNKIQTYDMSGAAPGTFVDIAGAPEAKFITLIKDQVFAGYDLSIPAIDRIRWSAIDDPTDWTPSATTMSDYQDNPDCGALMGLVGGSYGVALFEKTIKRLTFVGPPVIWEFDTIINAQGCMAEGSVVAYLNLTFYLSTAGFIQFDGNQATQIGAEQVDQYFFKDANMAFLGNMRGAVDPRAHMVIWVYQGAGDTDNVNGSCIIYNFALQKWSHGKMEASVLASVALPGYTLDELDSVNPDLDTLQASLDSRTWAGSLPFLGAMNYDANLCNFTAPPNQAVIDTKQIAFSEMRRSMLKAIYPLIEGDSTAISAMVWSKGRSENAWTSGPTLPENPEGWIATRREGRYHRVRVFIDGYWTHAMGVEYIAAPMGFR